MPRNSPSSEDGFQPSIDRPRDRPPRKESRRRFLAAAASGALVGIAGCLAIGGDGSDDDSNEESGGDGGTEERDTGGSGGASDEIAPPEPPERPLGSADVLELETGPRTVAVPHPQYDRDCGVRVLVRTESTATDDSPAMFRAGLFNERSESQTVQLRGYPPFEPTAIARAHGDERRLLYLVPTEETGLATTEPSYERGPAGYWRIDGAVRDWVPETVELGPEEAVGGLFYLLGEPFESGFPTRQYAFGSAPEGDLTLSVWNTNEPGPSPDSRFDPGQFPGLTYRLAADTIWYHDADPATPRYVVPSEERGTLPAGFEFELVNNSAASLTGGGGSWDLHKYADGEWFPLAPRYRTRELRILAPGDRREWTFLAFNGPVPDGVDEPAHGHLGGGTYAFRPTFTFEDAETFAAAFELDGDPTVVEPVAGLDAERDGDAVVVTDAEEDRAGDSPPDEYVVVERTDAADERVVPEQLMSGREPALRNALPYFEPDVDVVELRTAGATFGTGFVDDGGSSRFAYEGEAFEASVEAAD